MTTRKIAVVGASLALSTVLIASAPAGPRRTPTDSEVVARPRTHVIERAAITPSAREAEPATTATTRSTIDTEVQPQRTKSTRTARAGPVLVASLGRRVLTLHLDRKPALRTPIAVGSPESPTPVGSFHVTEKLDGRPWGGVYGCCILAINARQTRLPAGWTGGNRVAIHGTSEPGSIGLAVTAGCLRVPERPLRRLMALVPVGTPVVVRY